MATDDKDNDSPGDKKTLPKQVVVTHYGKKQKQPEGVPSEIMPTAPTHIISSPVDINANTSQPTPAEPIKPPVHVAPSPFEQASEHAHVQSQTTFSYGSALPPNEPPPSPEEGGYQQDGGSKGRGLFWRFVLTSSIIVLGYYTYSTSSQLAQLRQQTSDDQTSVLSLSEQAKKSLERIADLSKHHQLESKTLQDLKQQVENAEGRLVDLSGSNDWVLAQANYLAFMANERLHTAQDMTTAIAQLTAADEKLAALGNPALLWVRQALAKDLAKLHSFVMVNRQEIWEQLGVLSGEFYQLHFKRLSNEVATENDKSENSAERSNGWKSALHASWREFKGLVRITRLADNALPQALTEQEEAQVLRMMQLFCEQARWAILQGDAKVYKNSLASLKDWLAQYFMSDNVSAQILSQIAQLDSQQVSLVVPDISDSIQALSKASLQVQSIKQPSHQMPKGGAQ